MTDTEQPISPQPAGGAATTDSLQIESEIFCRIMEQLNTVSLRQTEGLLNIAVLAAQQFSALNSATGSANSGELSEFISRMKEASDDIQKLIQETAGKAAALPETNNFRRTIEQAIGNAIQNSVSYQQQLNELGAAILAKSSALLLQSRTN